LTVTLRAIGGDLVNGKTNDHTSDVREVLTHFGGNHFAWDIRPYLLETLFNSNENPKTVDGLLETIVAAEKLVDLDNGHFVATGKLKFRSTHSELLARAQVELTNLQKFQASTYYTKELDRWEFFYVCILKCAQLQRKLPGRGSTHQKVDEIIRFMHEELCCVSRMALTWALFWLGGFPEAAIFQKLEVQNNKTLKDARNIAWDLYHISDLSRQCLVAGEADFTIPCFLTADRKLALLAKAYALRLCLYAPALGQLYEVRAFEFHEMMKELTDGEFFHPYLSEYAGRERANFRASGYRADLGAIRRALESEISDCSKD
jgi:hypothetical protein